MNWERNKSIHDVIQLKRFLHLNESYINNWTRDSSQLWGEQPSQTGRWRPLWEPSESRKAFVVFSRPGCSLQTWRKFRNMTDEYHPAGILLSYPPKPDVPEQGTCLEVPCRLRPKPLLPIWDCVHQPATRPGAMVVFNHGAHGALAAVRRGGWKVRVRPEEVGSSRRWECEVRSTGRQSRTSPGESVAVGEEKGVHLDSTTRGGGEPGMPRLLTNHLEVSWPDQPLDKQVLWLL